MTKNTPDHLARGAYVYVRQSTAGQLMRNHESRRRQYGLADRARRLGWSDVVVIDDDLGRSGSGVSRPGFEKLLAAICEGRVGAVLSIEASRLARNGRDWHTLLEFCGLVGTLIVDEDGTYDPRHPNDRLLLGMKGTMSEMELSLLRQRSVEALRQKARRGELFLTVAVGYLKVRHDRIEKDPDRRVREALHLAFHKFAEFQSIRQVQLWLRQENIVLPAVAYGAEGRQIHWNPVEDRRVHLVGQARAGLRQPGMVRHTIPALQPQKLPQRQRIRAAPFQPALRVDALEVAHQVHAEIAPRRHRRRSHPGRVIAPAGRLGEAVEAALDQDRLQTVVKHMTRRARHLRPAHHQVPLTILLLSHRHRRTPRSNQNIKESDQAACVQCRLRQRAAKPLISLMLEFQ